MNTRVATCLMIAKVLVADGSVSEDEHAFLQRLMTKLGLAKAEQREVIDLDGLEEAELIVHSLSADERREIVKLLVDAASVDGHVSPHEQTIVSRLAAALGL